MTSAKTARERQKQYRDKGRSVSVVLRDATAIASLDRLTAKHGGVTAAVTVALSDHGRKK